MSERQQCSDTNKQWGQEREGEMLAMEKGSSDKKNKKVQRVYG